MKSRLLIVTCLCLVCAWSPPLVAEQQDDDESTVYPMMSGARKLVSFAMPLEKEVYAQSLDEVPDTPLYIDRDQIIASLAKRLRRMNVPVTDERTHADMAEAIYQADIEPILEPRVEKFNELINRQIHEDKVGVGLIAFDGLAKRMQRSSDIIPSFLVQGTYQYAAVKAEENTFRALDFRDSGRWEWSGDDVFISGTNRFSASHSGAIDETVEINLKPYGVERTFSMGFAASAEVKIEQTFGCDTVHRPDKTAGPKVAAQFQPYATIEVTKSLEGGSYLTFKDAKPYRDKHREDHPATFLVTLEAELPERVTPEPESD